MAHDLTAFHRLVVVYVEHITETCLEREPFERFTGVRLTRILNDGNSAADCLTVVDLRFDGDGLNHAVFRGNGLQLLLGDGLKQVTQEEDAIVRVVDQLLLVKAVQSAKEPVLSLVRLDAKREISLRQHHPIERVSGGLRLIRSGEAHVGGTSRAIHLLLLHEDGDRFVRLEQFHDVGLSEIPRQLVDPQVRALDPLRRLRNGAFARRFRQPLVLRVKLCDQELVRVRLHVVVVPSLDAELCRLRAVEINEGKPLRILGVLVDQNDCGYDEVPDLLFLLLQPVVAEHQVQLLDDFLLRAARVQLSDIDARFRVVVAALTVQNHVGTGAIKHQ